MTLVVNRRSVFATAAALLYAPASSSAQTKQAFDIATVEGAPIRNFRIAPDLAPSDLPGVVLVGPHQAKSILYEFFDYACGYCRLVALEIDFLLGPDADARLGLLHHPILTPGSSEAARFVLAAARLFGDETAYRLHVGLFEASGPAGATKALFVARGLALDSERLAREAAGDEVASILKAQADRARALSLPHTPSFTLGDFAFVGWPGVTQVQGFVESMRRCGGFACPGARP